MQLKFGSPDQNTCFLSPIIPDTRDHFESIFFSFFFGLFNRTCLASNKSVIWSAWDQYIYLFANLYIYEYISFYPSIYLSVSIYLSIQLDTSYLACSLASMMVVTSRGTSATLIFAFRLELLPTQTGSFSFGSKCQIKRVIIKMSKSPHASVIERQVDLKCTL